MEAEPRSPIEIRRSKEGLVQDTLIDGIKHITVRTCPHGAVTLYSRIDEFYCGFPALTPETAEDLAALLLASVADCRMLHERAQEKKRQAEAARAKQAEEDQMPL